jgi:AbrB family looped-hinge helix DNA binding protein
MGIIKGRIIAGGRIALPADIRRAMGVAEGDTVYFDLDGDVLRVRSAASSLRRIQDRLRAYRPGSGNVSDELIADRHGEAAGE